MPKTKLRRKLPEPSRLRELFSYDPNTGAITTKGRRGSYGRIPAGSRAGGRRPDGRWTIAVDGGRYLVSRVAWCIYYGQWPDGVIDHVNRDASDDRIQNLRVTTQAKNTYNKSKRSDSTAPYKGVWKHSQNHNWVAEIRKEGRKHHLGCFDSAEDAHAAYCAAADRLHGEFACYG